MDLHTLIDAALQPRAFVDFGGSSARIVLNEEDIDPPWSVEFWLWRPEIEEELMKRLKELEGYEAEYRAATENESKQHTIITALTKELQDAMAQWAETPSREMEESKSEVMGDRKSTRLNSSH